MLATLALIGGAAGATPASAADVELPPGIEITGLEQPDLPPIRRDDPSYRQMVLDYIDAVRDATPEAYFNNTLAMANRLLNIPPERDQDRSLWDPFDEDDPLKVNFAEKDSLKWPASEGGNGVPDAGWFWPGEKRIEVDPYVGPYQTEGTTLHELSHAAIDDRFGGRGPEYQEEPFLHGEEWRKLLDIAGRHSDLPAAWLP